MNFLFRTHSHQNPCENGGTLTYLNGAIECDCPTGFTGVRCETGKLNHARTQKVLSEGVHFDNVFS